MARFIPLSPDAKQYLDEAMEDSSMTPHVQDRLARIRGLGSVAGRVQAAEARRRFRAHIRKKERELSSNPPPPQPEPEMVRSEAVAGVTLGQLRASALQKAHLTELLRFALWMVREEGVDQLNFFSELVCWEFGLTEYTDLEITTVFEEVINTEQETEVDPSEARKGKDQMVEGVLKKHEEGIEQLGDEVEALKGGREPVVVPDELQQFVRASLDEGASEGDALVLVLTQFGLGKFTDEQIAAAFNNAEPKPAGDDEGDGANAAPDGAPGGA